MSRRVKDGVPLGFGVELRPADLDGLALRLLFLGVVHDVGEPPGVPALLLGLLLELLDGPAVDHAHVVHDGAADGGLARVDVADEHERGGFARGVHLHEVAVLLDLDVLDLLRFGRLNHLRLALLLLLVLLRLLLQLSLVAGGHALLVLPFMGEAPILLLQIEVFLFYRREPINLLGSFGFLPGLGHLEKPDEDFCGVVDEVNEVLNDECLLLCVHHQRVRYRVSWLSGVHRLHREEVRWFAARRVLLLLCIRSHSHLCLRFACLFLLSTSGSCTRQVRELFSCLDHFSFWNELLHSCLHVRLLRFFLSDLLSRVCGLLGCNILLLNLFSAKLREITI